MQKKKSVYRSLSEINITSLVDVTLCLLIIFMLTAPYIQGGVEVNLPQADTEKVIVEEGPVITVTKDRAIFFEEEPLDNMQAMVQRLQSYLPEQQAIPIYLRADAEIPYGFMLQVMATIEREGFTNMNLISEPES